MPNSELVNIVIQAKSYTPNRYLYGPGIKAITIHHMAGVMTAEQCGRYFQNKDGGSSHYGIGVNGDIGQYVNESDVAWTNSNWDSNCQSVTIETSNCSNDDPNWPVSDASLNSLIRLVADIAKRNNLGHLVKGVNVTWHSMFAATECPGPYLLSKLDYIIDEANKINEGPQPVPPTPTPTEYNIGDVVEINGVYVSSDSLEVLPPATNQGTITFTLEGARNPYLLDDGNIGWVNNDCIVRKVNEPTPEPTTLNVGDTIEIIGTGKASIYGDEPTAYGIGWIRTILNIFEGTPYPYQVGDETGTTGFYQADSLAKR